MFAVTLIIILWSKSRVNPKHRHPSFCLWCGDPLWLGIPYPPFRFYFGPNIAEETICVSENIMYQSLQKARKQKRRVGSIRQTVPLVTALYGWRRVCLHWHIWHYLPTAWPFIPEQHKWTTVQPITIKHISKSTNWTPVHYTPVAQPFSLHGRSSHTHIH